MATAVLMKSKKSAFGKTKCTVGKRGVTSANTAGVTKEEYSCLKVKYAAKTSLFRKPGKGAL